MKDKEWWVENIKTYPQDGNHQEVHTLIPLSYISKGVDTIYYRKNNKEIKYKGKKWIVLPNYDYYITLNIPIKEFDKVEDAIKYSINYMIDILRSEINNLEKFKI